MVKKIGILTSGGDAPGMNAAIRAVVRTGLSYGIEVFGICDGYYGLHRGQIKKLERQSVSDIVNHGGTFLGSARFPEFKEEKVRQESLNNMRKHGLEKLVVIGGNGSYVGAKKLTDAGLPCIVIPGTIDNDIAGTDYTIGFDTALNTVIDAIDRIRDTSSSHNRISLIEIMGCHCGDLALQAAIAGGAECLIIPEVGFSRHDLLCSLNKGDLRRKKHAIIAITEHMADVGELASSIELATGRETRATVLGHIQRGGVPTARDRVLASWMGSYAVDLLRQGCNGHCVGILNNVLVHHDIAQCIENMRRPFSQELYELQQRLF